MPDDEPAAPPRSPVAAAAEPPAAVPAHRRIKQPEGKPGGEAPAIAASVHTDALAYAREVSELCALAGFASHAAGFITAETPVAQVRAALLEARASADAETVIDAHHAPRTVRIPVNAAWDDTPGRVSLTRAAT